MSAATYASPIREEDPLTIYPNPAREKLTIKFSSESALGPEIQIIDLTGKVVLKVEEELNREDKLFRTEVELNDLKSGIYFVKVIQAKKIYTMKLIVE